MASAPYYQPVQNASFHDSTAQNAGLGNHNGFRGGIQPLQEEQAYEAAEGSQSNTVGNRSIELHNDGMTQAEREAQLAQLLEAVKAGASSPDPLSSGMYHAVIHDGSLPATSHTRAQNKRKRSSVVLEDGLTASSKRTKNDIATSASGQESTPQQLPSQTSTAAARAAGVHSAVALFRSPSSSTAKKATRPPMAKLYSSLHLEPESFLRLQAAAKTYMLDPEHPDRQECVGVKGHTSVDMAKLRLFNCVKTFLEQGEGEMYFPDVLLDDRSLEDHSNNSPVVTGIDSERWVWPKDAEQIISLVTPLMRRMVTNERQRMYAAETRKGGVPRKIRADESPSDEAVDASQVSNDSFSNGQKTTFDPSLNRVLCEQDDSGLPNHKSGGLAANAVTKNRPSNKRVQSQPFEAPQSLAPKCSTDVIQFVFMRNKTKLLRFDWPHDPAFELLHGHMTYDKLIDVVAEHLDRLNSQEDRAKADDNPGELLRRELQQIERTGSGEAQETETDSANSTAYSNPSLQRSFGDLNARVSALTADGLRNVESDETWSKIKQQVADAPWLEGCLRVVVNTL